MSDWYRFRGDGECREWTDIDAPPWRRFDGGPVVRLDPSGERTARRERDRERGRVYQASAEEIELVNVAMHLRRPLLISGKPGLGKSSLAYAVAYELQLGPVLRWSITSGTTLQEGLYRYDAIGRLQDANLARHGDPAVADIGRYIHLGPLGTALLPYDRPRVLLIDEIDKSDIDLPNDLLNIFEEGEYRIPELARLGHDAEPVRASVEHSADPVEISQGLVRCREFPIVILTSNREREFPPAFLRRCVRLDMHEPDEARLRSIVEAHFDPATREANADLIERFLELRAVGDLATDQLLNAIFLVCNSARDGQDRQQLAEVVLRHLATDPTG
ncbi:AAA family ATPase [Micromonospora cathayae]|uniref:MoxR family ATPase n=1 Tax=Micromonospora cathayae TaxID=3028804 RepID=A0ABY8A0G6_9ACTN|nr:MoxR family ATPase [Micromonospora sp. HUAS 3]WDZ87489.1 MoxR family ATPase [Micromonospora sp. HUAS 3]